MDTISNIWNNITTSVSDVFSSISLMTFGGEPAKKSGKMMALKSSTSTVVIPKFLSSDDNGNLSMFDLDKHTTDNDFSALSLSTPGKVTAKGDVTGGRLCIGNTCIDENQLKQLVRGDINVDLNPLDYYEMTGTTLLLEHYQDVKPLGWSLVKTIVPGNKGMRIVQQAYKSAWTGNASLDSDVSKMYTRYSLSDKIGIEKDSTKNGWTEWSTERFVGDWTLTTKLDGNLRFYNGGQNKLLVQTDGKLWKSDKAAYI